MFIGIQNIIDLKASNSEYAMLISTNIQNDDTYYTDLNGLQVIIRQIPIKIKIRNAKIT